MTLGEEMKHFNNICRENGEGENFYGYYKNYLREVARKVELYFMDSVLENAPYQVRSICSHTTE